MRRDARTGAGAAGRGVGGGDVRIRAVIDVEKGALRALEKNVRVAAHRFVEIDDGVGHERLQHIARFAVGGVDFFERERPGAKRLEDFVVLPDLERKLFRKPIRVYQVDHPQAGARGLVAVGRADPAFGGADFIFALEDFALLIEFAMIRQDQVGGLAEKQITVHLHLHGAQHLDLGAEADRIDDDAVADDAGLAGAQDAGRDQMEHVFLFPDEDRVAGVVAALGADDDVRVLGQHVDDFALAFVAPLGADENSIGHSVVRRPPQ